MKTRNNMTAGITSFLLFFFATLFIIDRLEITQSQLKVNDPINADLLIIEGWLYPRFYENVILTFDSNNYEKILVTGNIISKSVILYEEGLFIAKNFYNLEEGPGIKKVTAKLNGSYAKGAYSNCRIFKNDSLIAEREAIGNTTITFNCYLNTTDSLVFEFNNDAVEGGYDRNLSLEKLTIGSQKIDLYSNFIWIDSHYNYACSGYYLESKITANELISRGIPKNKIDYVISDNHKLSRTYGAASEAVKWMKENDFSSANIISLSYHSKRTLLSFNKAGSDLDFGIYSIDAGCSKIRTIKEILGNFLIRLTPNFILEWELK